MLLVIPDGSPVAYRQPAEPLRACESRAGHLHNYDHLTIVLRGRVRVEKAHAEGAAPFEVREYGAGEEFPTAATVFHTITALEDGTLYKCVFSHRDFDGVVSQTFTGNLDAYA